MLREREGGIEEKMYLEHNVAYVRFIKQPNKMEVLIEREREREIGSFKYFFFFSLTASKL